MLNAAAAPAAVTIQIIAIFSTNKVIVDSKAQTL
jgi:hypothetical protein